MVSCVFLLVLVLSVANVLSRHHVDLTHKFLLPSRFKRATPTDGWYFNERRDSNGRLLSKDYGLKHNSDNFDAHAEVREESTKDSNQFIETLRIRIDERLLKKESRLTSTREKFGGYCFLIKNQYSLENAFKVINTTTTFDQSYLEKFVQECLSKEMPKHDTGLWEVLVFDKRAQWLETNKKQYIFVFRCHHGLGDGFALLDLLIHQFSDEKIQPETHRTQWEKSGTTTSWFTLLKYALYGPAQVAVEKFSRPPDANFLHRNNLCGEKIIAWAVEEKPHLVPLVKLMKNQLPETRFSDVVLCAISKSLNDFYSKKSQMVPKHITCVIPVLLKARSNGNIFNLTNRYSVGELTLPVLTDNVLEEVRKYTRILKNSPDIFVYHWLLNIVAFVLPELALKRIFYSGHSTAVISILPGFNKISCLDGDTIRDVIYWIPNRGSTGVGISVLTYENRLQIGIVVDKELPLNQSDAQMIVDGVFTSIIDLYSSNFGTFCK
ncbi:hypothetical protein TcasGA2_TC034843 [Tribolium castaneum]|uniref:O-acyltransferase WSD1 C-terminal domain-containing protein n=1 Tax=Tribolium castaneum TaxID=7070 RepID=A0A139WD73_TRICA|nr:hypothetical protein TcasGA2_TC034843 [Tribolium castaneum]